MGHDISPFDSKDELFTYIDKCAELLKKTLTEDFEKETLIRRRVGGSANGLFVTMEFDISQPRHYNVVVDTTKEIEDGKHTDTGSD